MSNLDRRDSASRAQAARVVAEGRLDRPVALNVASDVPECR
jgi:hypothetical protein